MKYLFIVIISLSVISCAKFQKFRTPFSVHDASTGGDYKHNDHTMLLATKKRYWLSYRYALAQAGYVASTALPTAVPTTPPSNAEASYKSFDTIGLKEIKSNVDANKQFWREGQVYSKLLCSSYFKRLTYSYAHREHAKAQTNIAGGLISAAMGLADASAEAVGGTALLFSGAESSFDAYNTSFLVTPDISLVEGLVRESQEKIATEIETSESRYFQHVSGVIDALNEYNYPCTFSGMKALMEKSLTITANEVKQGNIDPLTLTGKFDNVPNVIDAQANLRRAIDKASAAVRTSTSTLTPTPTPTP